MQHLIEQFQLLFFSLFFHTSTFSCFTSGQCIIRIVLRAFPSFINKSIPLLVTKLQHISSNFLRQGNEWHSKTFCMTSSVSEGHNFKTGEVRVGTAQKNEVNYLME